MTVSECSNLLLEWYKNKENRIFTLEKSIEIIKIAEEPEERDALLKASLEYLSELNIVHKTTIREKDFWVLKKRVECYTQTVEINETLAIAIAKEINLFCELIDDYSDVCTAGNIEGKDIKNLLLIYRHAKDKVLENLETDVDKE